LPATTAVPTLNVLPQLSVTTGGVGATASAGQATVVVAAAGMVTTGGRTVVVCVQVYVVLAQSVYVKVYATSPEQVGLPVITAAPTLNVLPQLSVTVGGVGVTASAGQATVEVVAAGMVTTGGRMVVVCVQVYVVLAQSV
jgi:hypothetical protein